jgi:hypothetical protein
LQRGEAEREAPVGLVVPLLEEVGALEHRLDQGVKRGTGKVGGEGARLAASRQQFHDHRLEHAGNDKQIGIGPGKVPGLRQQGLENQHHQRHVAAVCKKVARGARGGGLRRVGDGIYVFEGHRILRR